ncbi:hypothetical protein B0T14DRAFT_426222 [Immersiella caudata]|uniref:Zn(2)-C6 fungal-type domain-containing protein n=1 Tax=Immersiella caudata TaxID=314043 RepID=A0AA39WXE7_9PEZI|nr:hypothetical protein B0T14DRAFT_426222 [Immersiella caudata]
MFAHTFLVTNSNGRPTLEVVAPEETTMRKKRPHRCDENDPCSNCVKRGERCVRAPAPPLSSGTPGSDGSPPATELPQEIDWCPLSEPDGVPVNLLHMELLHHFERFTIPTLIFQEIWPTMLQLAFRPPGPDHVLDLSGDRLYWLSTGQRQIFFMAWPLFQREESIFMRVGILRPCMALSDEVEARGLNWRKYARIFEEIYDNPRYQGGREGAADLGEMDSEYSGPGTPELSLLSDECPLGIFSGNPPLDMGFDLSSSSTDPSLRVSVLFDSYKEGEAFVKSGGLVNEGVTRSAYKRLSERISIAMVFLADSRREAGCNMLGLQNDPSSWFHSTSFSQEDMARYVLTFPMLCFGPLLPLISRGDSRMLLLLYHVYQMVEELLPSDRFWWCRKRSAVMRQSMIEELRERGLQVCTRHADEGLW